MKYLKMYEDFNESEIHELCKKYNITNYTINNGVVDVDDDVSFYNQELRELPLKFGIVTGNFHCSHNKLTSLIGCPIYVGGHFNCGNNCLTTLEGCPEKVTNGLYCYSNKLTSLIGCPAEVGEYFNCSYNILTTLEFGPEYVGSHYVCNHNRLTSLEGCPISVGDNFSCDNNPVNKIYKLFPDYQSFIDSLDYNYFREGIKINKIRFTQALEEINKECPENIKGYVWE